MHALDADDVRAAVPMLDVIDAVESAFSAFGRGEFEMPTRHSLGDGGFLVMSAFHRPSGSGMVKTLSIEFSRAPAIVGSVVWSDASSVDLVVADASAVTALRTGAVSGVATRLLSSPDAARLTVIGAGAQAADQVRAVCAVRDITHLTLVDADRLRAEALAGRMAAELGLAVIEVLDDADEAVSGADVVCCATTAREPLFSADSLLPEVHVNAIGAFLPSMRELPDDLLGAAGALVVDDLVAVTEEAGEIIHALESGAIRTSMMTELSAALRNAPPRGGRTVFKSVGIAVQDWAVARLLAGRTRDERPTTSA